MQSLVSGSQSDRTELSETATSAPDVSSVESAGSVPEVVVPVSVSRIPISLPVNWIWVVGWCRTIVVSSVAWLTISAVSSVKVIRWRVSTVVAYVRPSTVARSNVQRYAKSRSPHAATLCIGVG